MKEDGHVALPRQGWEEAAERPGEVVHASYEVVFAPMVFVRKVGCLAPLFFVRLPRATASEGPSTATELLGASRLNAAAVQCSRDHLRKTRLMG